jgi:Domain of unknown function (DUF4386)
MVMRTDILRWGGIFSVLLALFFATTLALGFAMGVDIYADGEPDELLTDINSNEIAFLTWSILSMVAQLLLIPAVLGFFYATRDDDRPYFALAAAFFGIAVVMAVFGYAMGPVLWDVASNYVEAQGPTRDALLQDGQNLQSILLIIGGLSMTPFALGMIAVAVLSLRSGFFPRWLAWATILVGVVGLIPFIGFVAIVPGRIVWLLIGGVLMVRRAQSEEAPLHATTHASTMPA